MITNCLKYIQQQISNEEKQLVPYHLLSLLVQLISKISSKSKQINIAEPIPQFLSIFDRIFKFLSIQNQYDLWLSVMKQYQSILIFNKDLLTRNHEGTFNIVLGQYKQQVIRLNLEIFGEVGHKQFDANLVTMVQDLFYSISLEKLLGRIDTKQRSEEVLNKLSTLAKIHLESTTDVLI